LLCPPSKTLSGLGIQAISHLGEADDVRVAPEVIVGRPDVGTANGVRKVERERAAGELDFVVRDRGNVAHLTHPTA